MELLLPITIQTLNEGITYKDKITLIGSCFTEHIGNSLKELKFPVLQNPNGIVYDPASIAQSLVACIYNRPYTEKDLFHYNELWHSWQHHGHFSGTDKEAVLEAMNQSQNRAHDFLKQAKWLLITPGTAFSYRLTRAGATASASMPEEGVANCHKAPGSWFTKYLVTIEEINTIFDNCIHQLFQFNPSLQIIFTVSPVRHIRDGIVHNNRSKARLLEVIHHLVNKFERLYYFPAYELVVDVLRDYRFYEVDMVHPNKQAVQFVLEQFMQYCVDAESRQLAAEIQKINTARNHKAFQPATEAHKKFLHANLEKVKELQLKYPFLDMQEELEYFEGENRSRT